MEEIRFIPNPDYPPDWEEWQKEKYGIALGVKTTAKGVALSAECV